MNFFSRISKCLAINKNDGDKYRLDGSNITKCKMEFGRSFEEIEFLSKFQGPIIDDLNHSIDVIKDKIRSSLLSEFEKHESLLDKYYHNLTKRRRLIVFLMLRVNGSYPIYGIRGMPDTLEHYLVSNSGNCSDHSYRAAIIYQLFGNAVRTIHFRTTSVPGHSAVEVLDPEENTAYLVDTNANCLFYFEGAHSGFLEHIMDLAIEDRIRLYGVNGSNRILAPVYIPYYDPGLSLSRGYATSVSGLNQSLDQLRHHGWPTTLTVELLEMIRCWVSPKHMFGSVNVMIDCKKRPTLAAFAFRQVLWPETLLAKAATFFEQAGQ